MVQSYAKRIGKDEGSTAQLMFDAAANIGVGSSGGGGGKLGVGAGGGAQSALFLRLIESVRRHCAKT